MPRNFRRPSILILVALVAIVLLVFVQSRLDTPEVFTSDGSPLGSSSPEDHATNPWTSSLYSAEDAKVDTAILATEQENIQQQLDDLKADNEALRQDIFNVLVATITVLGGTVLTLLIERRFRHANETKAADRLRRR
jgi:hypothetical protein